MKSPQIIQAFLIIVIFGLLVSACQSVKPYQRIYLNDDAMQMNKRPVEKFSSKVHTYREAASGGGRGKSTGGCGCN